jgi:hypothetical protein
MTDAHPQPYVQRSSAVSLEDLQRRLRATRWPDVAETSSCSIGTDVGHLQEITTYWSDEFDWAEKEEALFNLPRFRVTVDR